MQKGTERMLVFVGSYADAADSGIYVYSMDENTGELALLDEVAGLNNPTFLNLDVRRRRLYSIADELSDAGGKVAEAVAFSIDHINGSLRELNRVTAVDAPTCHIQRDADDRYLVLSSYHGGKLGLVSLSEDGRIGERLDMKQHEGRGTHPERQNQPHPHSANFSPDNRYVFVPDLGLDVIRAYTIDAQRNVLQFHGDTRVHAGAGPRHMAFHPNGRFALVINEIDSTITSFTYHRDIGELDIIQTVPTLPVDFKGNSTCAEIAVSEDGNFVYGSNRGHDSIVVYAIDQTSGRLTLVEHVSSEGQHPRHFTLTPGGRFMIVANRDTNNLVVYRVDPNGKLRLTGHSVQASKPVCVKAAYFPI